MDYETLDVLYRSRKTLLKLLAMRGYATKAYEKFGPIEIAAMAAAESGGGGAFRMDLERQTDSPISKCRVEYSISRIKNRLPGFLEGLTEEGNDAAVDPETTELVVIVTPFIVRPVKEQQLATPVDGLNPPTDLQQIFLGRLNRVYGPPGGHPAGVFHGQVGHIID
jgi:hypothetical protein